MEPWFSGTKDDLRLPGNFILTHLVSPWNRRVPRSSISTRLGVPSAAVDSDRRVWNSAAHWAPDRKSATVVKKQNLHSSLSATQKTHGSSIVWDYRQKQGSGLSAKTKHMDPQLSLSVKRLAELQDQPSNKYRTQMGLSNICILCRPREQIKRPKEDQTTCNFRSAKKRNSRTIARSIQLVGHEHTSPSKVPASHGRPLS